MITEGLIAATIAAASIISPATAGAGKPMAAELGTLDPRTVMVISQSARGVGYAGDVQVVSVAGPTVTWPVLSAVPPRPTTWLVTPRTRWNEWPRDESAKPRSKRLSLHRSWNLPR